MVIDATSKGNFSKLTRHRVPGALPYGAKYRLIDFALSNCKNSGINNVAIFPYGNYRSLSDHIGSGDRWDLNRRHDGIFILPPKNFNLNFEDSISFQRMYEHIEYFNRSNQKYVIIQPSNLVWNVDYKVFLFSHLSNKADITEILSKDNKRLKTYIISKELLLEYVTSYDQIQFRNLSDVFDYAPKLKRNTYIFEHPCFYINSAKELYDANMALLNPEIRKNLFRVKRPIFSKETMSAPSRYCENASVKNSIIASGAHIDGEVVNSIIGRKVKIRKGAKVINSIVMNQCKILEDSVLEYSVLDKETKVVEKSVVKGTEKKLFVSEKGQTVVSNKELTVLQVTAECFPYAKTGGLADMVGSLAIELSNLGVKSEVIMPLYQVVKEKYKLLLEIRAANSIYYGGKNYKVTIYSLTNHHVTYYFIESYDFFDRDCVYGCEDDGDRFAFFSLAALSFLDVLEQKPDIIHVHDWHGGMVPLLVKEKNLNIKTLLTIHNIEYQGVHEGQILKNLDINDKDYHIRMGKINFLELGLQYADKISTVSETYRDELKYEYYSKNFVDIINRRYRDFYGILNGIDSDISPTTDLEIMQKYSSANVFEAKQINKKDLQKKHGLEIGNDYFILGMVSRIAEQKGFDILIPALIEVLRNEKIQFIILGAGDEHYKNNLQKLKDSFPDRVSLNLEYDATKPAYIYAGADVFLMPSRYEPCGTGQMIALKYGTIPIVRQTGGLNDTVDIYDMASKQGNGFKFYNYDYRDLVFQIQNAFQIFENSKEDWRQLIMNAIKSDFPLSNMAREYIELYEII